MADLTETTLSQSLGPDDRIVTLASVTGVAKDDVLYLDGEAMRCVAAPSGSSVRVMRGILGTVGGRHLSGVPVYHGEAHEFYTHDPKGQAPAYPLTHPWINVTAGRVWHASGDVEGPGAQMRSWELETVSFPVGALGIRGAQVPSIL